MRALNYAHSLSLLSVTANVTATATATSADPTLLLLCSFLLPRYRVLLFFLLLLFALFQKNHFIRCAQIFRFRLIFHDFYANFLMVLESVVTITRASERTVAMILANCARMAAAEVMVMVMVYISIFRFQRQPYIFVLLFFSALILSFSSLAGSFHFSFSFAMPFSKENVSCSLCIHACVFFFFFRMYSCDFIVQLPNLFFFLLVGNESMCAHLLGCLHVSVFSEAP